MTLNEEGGEVSPVFVYGDHQVFLMLNTKICITPEDYEAVCKEVFFLRTFIAKSLKKRAGEALARLTDKL